MTLKRLEIPLSSIPETFSIVLGGRDFRLTLVWIEAPEGGWVLDITDGASGEALVSGLPLITGANLLEPYPEIFGKTARLEVESRGEKDATPTRSSLGTLSRLIFISPETE